MMVVTAAASLLGSSLMGKLNQQNFNYMIAANPAGYTEEPLRYSKLPDNIRETDLPAWLAQNYQETEFVFLIDNSSYIHHDQPLVDFPSKLQLNQKIWQSCTDLQVPLLYLSCTPGTAEAQSSQQNAFLAWAQAQSRQPFFWAALVLPEVYGPGEPQQKHPSVVYRAYQAWQQGEESFRLLIESLLPRQMVYVKDVVEVCYFLVHHRRDAGVYEIGMQRQYTGQQLAQALRAAMAPPPGKEVGDAAAADAAAADAAAADAAAADAAAADAAPAPLQAIGYTRTFFSLQAGIRDCVKLWHRALLL